MRKISLVVLACLSTAACATREQSAGTTAGVIGGAVVGGPVGAVVGGVAGALVSGPGGPIDPRHCYVRDGRGNVRYDSAGRARARRC